MTAGAAVIAGSSWLLYHAFLTPPKADDLPTQITALTQSLNGAAKTIGEIERQIKQRQLLVEQLEREAQTASNLKTLNKDQLDAVAAVLNREIKSDQSHNFWGTQALAFFYAAVGVALSELYRFILRWRKRRRLAQGNQ